MKFYNMDSKLIENKHINLAVVYNNNNNNNSMKHKNYSNNSLK